jgi:membrane fusion protein (multidrug efflux system)
MDQIANRPRALTLLRLGLIALLAGGLASCGEGQGRTVKSLPPVVGFVTIRQQPLQLSVELPGRTSPFAVSEIRPQVSGIILHRFFTEGAIVKAGGPLYQIDPAPYQAAYDNAVATQTDAKAKADRYATLMEANAIASQQADDAQAAYLVAKANLEAARINLAYTRITAPITGHISASTVTEGALVTANQATALATVSALDPIYVDIDQSSTELIALKRALQQRRIGAGTTNVMLKLDDGSAYPVAGKLQFADVTVDQTTGTVQLRALFPNPEGLLLPGIYVRASVVEGIDPHGILAPQHGITHDLKGQPIALVADDEGVARIRILKIGRVIGADWQVLDGLKPGDRMIVQGLQKVRPGAPVKLVPIVSGQS